MYTICKIMLFRRNYLRLTKKDTVKIENRVTDHDWI